MAVPSVKPALPGRRLPEDAPAAPVEDALDEFWLRPLLLLLLLLEPPPLVPELLPPPLVPELPPAGLPESENEVPMVYVLSFSS